MVDDERIRLLLEKSTTDSASTLCEDALQAAYESGNHPWSRVYEFLHPRNQNDGDDLTAVALVRCGDMLRSSGPPGR